MINSFKNILIPVDFSINTEVAVKKVMELAEPDTNIYLLYVEQESNNMAIFPSQQKRNGQFKPDEIEHKINEWKNCIADNEKKVQSLIVTYESVEKAIIDYARRLSVDLIILAKKTNHSWFPFLNTVTPSHISKQTGIVVLTLKPGGIYNKVKTMIVPITNENVMNKVGVIHAICKKNRVNILLLAFLNEEEKREGYYASIILRIYQNLKTNLNCQVEYTITRKNNKARTILDYARKFNADILVVNPDIETKVGWPNKHISDMLPARSKLQVWAV